MASGDESGTLIGVQLNIAKIEGMLTQVLTTYSAQIEENKKNTVQLRVDLTAVKDNADRKAGELSTKVTQNTSAIADIRDDIVQVRTKQDASFGKAMLIASPGISILALIWNVVGAK
jgi:hypothetical protein